MMPPLSNVEKFEELVGILNYAKKRLQGPGDAVSIIDMMPGNRTAGNGLAAYIWTRDPEDCPDVVVTIRWEDVHELA